MVLTCTRKFGVLLYSAGLIFMVCQSTTKTVKIGPLENFPLYGSYWQECMMMLFLFWREEEERVTSYSGRSESRIFHVYYE